MKLQKRQRRERALARFHIQTEAQWNDGRKPNRQVSGTYADYVNRKQHELASLEETSVAYLKHIGVAK